MQMNVLTMSLVLTAGLSASAHSMQQPPPAAKPGPAHEVLKSEAGTWDAKVEVIPAPGAPPMMSTGVETNVMGCGGLCLITDFKGTMGGETFEGHGVATYDPAKKKYVGTWTDSMSFGLSTSEGTWDPAKKTSTGWMEGPDASGKVMKMRSVVVHKDAKTRVMTLYGPGPDGKEFQMMQISYTKR